MATETPIGSITGPSPHRKARAAGASWLMTFVAGFVSLSTWGRLVVSGDPAATSANILTNSSLFRLAFVADLTGVLTYIAVTLLVYELLKPVNRSVSLLAAFFSLVGCAVGGIGCAVQLLPVGLFRGTQYLSVFTLDQLQALAYLSIRFRADMNSVALIFFGFHCLLIGYLILRSQFLPRTIGALMVAGGLGWLTHVSPSLTSALSPWVMLPGMIGEASLTVWLLFKGVDVQRWTEQATAALRWQPLPAGHA